MNAGKNRAVFDAQPFIAPGDPNAFAVSLFSVFFFSGLEVERKLHQKKKTRSLFLPPRSPLIPRIFSALSTPASPEPPPTSTTRPATTSSSWTRPRRSGTGTARRPSSTRLPRPRRWGSPPSRCRRTPSTTTTASGSSRRERPR